MAADYLEAVRTIQSHGPYLLGGWSMGGLIALEMARQIEAQGEEVRLVALFDTKAPDGEEEVIDDESLLPSFALHLGLSPEQIQEAVSQAPGEDYLSFMLDYLKGASIIPHDMSLARLNQQFRVFKANIHASRSYRPKDLPAGIVLFRAAERSLLGWSQELEVFETPGSHMTMMQEPNVSVLAERLATYLSDLS